MRTAEEIIRDIRGTSRDSLIWKGLLEELREYNLELEADGE